MNPVAVSAFYKFTPLESPASLRGPLLKAAQEHGIKGTILLAPEGINGTIAGKPSSLAAMMDVIRGIPDFGDMESKESHAEDMPFRRMKVRLKKEIVTMGVAGLDPRHMAGSLVAPEDWNALISDPEVMVIDTRNGFEVAAGTFRGAIDPRTRSFGEFPAFAEQNLSGHEQRRIAMFCTGGIRCEKATSFLRQKGFAKVYHLKGGILKYLEIIPPERSLWQGSCFVFDEREGLGHGLEVLPPRT
jgi:UPF0176 protein